MKYIKIVRDYIVITFAAALFAVSISLFLDPNSLAPGGVSGLAVILNHTFGLPTGIVIFAINIPLLAIGFFKIGRVFAVRTLYATLVYSTLIDLSEKYFAKFIPLTADLFLASIAGGVIMALAMGTMYRFGGSTGGTDIIVKLIRRKKRNLKTGGIYLIVDAVIVTIAAITSKSIDIPLYSAISIVITSKLLDRLLYGTDEAKLLFIISDRDTRIADCLLKEIDLGVTYFDGEGGYTKAEKKVLFCAVKKHNYHKVRDIVKREDQKAFMIVTNASEIFGEGYKSHTAEEL